MDCLSHNTCCLYCIYISNEIKRPRFEMQTISFFSLGTTNLESWKLYIYAQENSKHILDFIAQKYNKFNVMALVPCDRA